MKNISIYIYCFPIARAYVHLNLPNDFTRNSPSLRSCSFPIDPDPFDLIFNNSSLDILEDVRETGRTLGLLYFSITLYAHGSIGKSLELSFRNPEFELEFD